MKVKDHYQLEEGKYRKARKTHPCNMVKYFGQRPHAECTGEIKPTQYYFDMCDGDNGSIYKTHKLCRFCAEMELDESRTMSPDERKKYREKQHG